ncbi:hypothetical protein D3C73_933390 [compost metagenome]
MIGPSETNHPLHQRPEGAFRFGALAEAQQAERMALPEIHDLAIREDIGEVPCGFIGARVMLLRGRHILTRQRDHALGGIEPHRRFRRVYPARCDGPLRRRYESACAIKTSGLRRERQRAGVLQSRVDGLSAVVEPRLAIAGVGGGVIAKGVGVVRPEIEGARQRCVKVGRHFRLPPKTLTDRPARTGDGLHQRFLGGGRPRRIDIRQHIFGKEAVARLRKLLRLDRFVALIERHARKGRGRQQADRQACHGGAHPWAAHGAPFFEALLIGEKGRAFGLFGDVPPPLIKPFNAVGQFAGARQPA